MERKEVVCPKCQTRRIEHQNPETALCTDGTYYKIYEWQCKECGYSFFTTHK